jgi:WD40 repeat protein
MLEGHSGGVSSVSFDGTGSRIVPGSDDNTVRVWHDVETIDLDSESEQGR